MSTHQTQVSPALAELFAPQSFQETIKGVLARLTEAFPLACWTLLRLDSEGNQIPLALCDSVYGLDPKSPHRLEDSLCAQMLAGAPAIAHDVSLVEPYRTAADRLGMEVGTYAGAPVLRPDGSVFATLAGFDPAPSPESIQDHRELLTSLAQALTSSLELELARLSTERTALLARWVPDPQGPPASLEEWEEFLEFEERAHAALGEPAAVVLIEIVGGTLRDPYRMEKQIYQATGLLRARLRSHDLVARVAPNRLAVLLSSVSAQVLPSVLLRMNVGLNLHDLEHELAGEVRSSSVSLDGAQNKAVRALNELVRFR